VSQLSCHDLCALRLTNHKIHTLIHENESTIVRNHLREEKKIVPKYFKPAGSLSLDYEIELRYRFRQCRRLATFLATECCAKLEPLQLLYDSQGWRKRKAKKLRENLVMNLFAVYEFLARFREVVLRSLHEFEGCSTADFARLGFVLGLDQQGIFDGFPGNSLMPILYAWRILEGIANSKGISFNCKATKYPFTTVKVVLVLGGLDRFMALISKASLKERLQDLDAYNAEIWQNQTWKAHVGLLGPPLASIHHLAPPPKRTSSREFPQSMSPTAAITFINRQLICEPSLTAVILRLFGTIEDILSVERYVRDVVNEEGDSFHLLPSWNMPDGP
jgi:hypothetical protein